MDAATAGPLDIVALIPLHRLGAPLDFFGARLTALLLLWGTLLACYGAIRTHASPTHARLALLPAVLLSAMMTEGGFVFYSTEHVPVFLIAVSCWCLARAGAGAPEAKATAAWLYGGAAAAAMLPWAKIQTAPFAAALVLIALLVAGRLAQPARRLVGAIAAAVAPTVIGIAALALVGEFETAWRSYILQNLAYVGAGAPWSWLLTELGRQFVASWSLAFLAVITLSWTIAALATDLAARERPRFAALAAIGLIAAATITVVAPRRAFPHYFLFFLPPFALCLAAGVLRVHGWASTTLRRRAVVVAVLLSGAIGPVLARTAQPVPFMIGILGEHWRHPRCAVSEAVLRYARKGDRLALWGWNPTIYVETGLPQGVRDGHVQRQVEGSQQQRYFLERYCADIATRHPELFLDTVGPGGGPIEDRARFGHEAYPELARAVSGYRLVEEIDYARIYVRADLYGERGQEARARTPPR